MVLRKYMKVGNNIDISGPSTNLIFTIQLCAHLSSFMHYICLCICLVLCVTCNNETPKILSGWQVFCYYTCNLPLSLFIPLSPRLQSWKFGSWLLAAQHQSQQAGVGAAGLLTLACLLQSGISQPLLDSNETYGKGSGRGFFLLNTKPEKVKLFRGGKDALPEWPSVSWPQCWTARSLELCWNYCAMGCNGQHASGSCEGWGEEADLRPDKHRFLFFFPWSFYMQSLCSRPLFRHI